MKEIRRLWLHLALLLTAAVVAYVYARPSDEADRPLEPGEVELWGGSPKDITRITYEAKRQTVTLEQATDDHGSWFRGKVEPVEEKPEEPKVDGGRPPRKRPPVEPATFVSVKAMERIGALLAPMRAKRAIGEVAAEREKAFGLDEPAGTLHVEIGSKKHSLVIGKKTPGATSRYVRDLQTQNVYLIVADAVKDLEGGAARLSERSLHSWKQSEVEKVSIIDGKEVKDVIRSGTAGRRFYAEPATPDVNFEMAGNWLSKVGRLRPIKFVESLPEGTIKVVRVEYRTKDDTLGFVEVHRHDTDAKDQFYVTSEHLRLHATVAKSMAEQVVGDLPSVFGKETEEGEDEGDEKEDDDKPSKPEPKDADKDEGKGPGKSEPKAPPKAPPKGPPPAPPKPPPKPKD
ncbi:MAG: DUF4340 domain-containing protein [Deltaproteobacteria bacterium]|nr:DUF4340 domain-containing protein [Deltaproteobacteria bacterium]